MGTGRLSLACMGETQGDPGGSNFVQHGRSRITSFGFPRNDRSDSKVEPWGTSICRLLGNEISSPLVNHDQFTASVSLISSVMRSMPQRRTCRTTRPTDPGVDPILAHAGLSPSSMSPLRFGDRMRGHYRTGAAAILLIALIAVSATVRSTAESGPEAQPQNVRLPIMSPAKVQASPQASPR